MTGKTLMLKEEDVRRRARTAFDRNWRQWAHDAFLGVENEPTLSVSLHPPREADLTMGTNAATAREWVALWRDCPLDGVEWQQRSWASVGNQSIPVRVCIEGASQIARWADRQLLWKTALERMDDVAGLIARLGYTGRAAERISDPLGYGSAGHADFSQAGFSQAGTSHAVGSAGCAGASHAIGSASNAGASSAAGYAGCAGTSHAADNAGHFDTSSASGNTEQVGSPHAVADAVRLSIADWCALGAGDWKTALRVWDWLFKHLGETCYIRQLPIRGIDTKWIERHDKAIRKLHQAITGCDFTFAQPGKQFRCKACCPSTTLGGCDEFSLSAAQLDVMEPHPNAIVICENLVNALCLHDLPDTMAIHGSGFAVHELRQVSWLPDTSLLYWGDLDSNGFAILNLLRSFAPHARSVMMDNETLHRHFDLCVTEPTPAAGTFENLTPDELDTLHQLAQGDPTRNITDLRLEQERIEWDWAFDRISQAIADM